MSDFLIKDPRVPSLLLIEPDNLIRSTVAGICKQLNLARITQAASVAVAERLLDSKPVDLMMVSLNEGDGALDFLERLRAGAWRSVTDAPLAVTSESAHGELVSRVKPLAVKKLLLQPYKVKDVILTIESLRLAMEEV